MGGRTKEENIVVAVVVVVVVVKETLKISIINCGKRSHGENGRKSVRNDFGCNGGGAAAINYSLFARFKRTYYVTILYIYYVPT